MQQKKNMFKIVTMFLVVFTILCMLSGIINFVKITSSVSEEHNLSYTNFTADKVSTKEIFLNENFSKYTLSVELNETSSTIEGNMTVDFYNNDPISFSRLPFHLYPSGMGYENRSGTIDILNVRTLTNIPLSFEVLPDKQLMWIDLESTVAPNQFISFIITFSTTLPDGQDRANSYGWDHNQSRIYTCACLYPIPCVYDEFDGWNTDLYLDIGDPFYLDMAYYDLFIEVPDGMIVAATGELIKRTTDGLTTTYHYNPIYPVREVTFSASRYFVVESTLVNGVNVSSYYLPQSSSLWNHTALYTAVRSLTLFNESFGIYPYPTYNIVEAYGFYYGMECPCQVYMSESLNYRDDLPGFFEITLAHETAHQWWYQLVGNDQVDEGHLDEGLTCWSHQYYTDYYYPSWNTFDHQTVVISHHSELIEANKINQSIYECIESNTSYRFTAYHKTPIILQKLRVSIGHENFIAGLRYFFEHYKFKIAFFPNLQQSFEAVIGQSLNWFFLPWFDNNYLPNYKFTSVTYDTTQELLSITIKDLNEVLHTYPYSQQLILYVFSYFGNESQILTLSETVWINGTTTLEFPLSKEPIEVELYFNHYALVQTSAPEITSIKTSDMTLISSESSSETADLEFLSLLSILILSIGVLIRRKIHFQE
ncbi:MAG: M1 family metallopeptidase [Candidatus Hodarchaeota archaeon]